MIDNPLLAAHLAQITDRLDGLNAHLTEIEILLGGQGARAERLAEIRAGQTIDALTLLNDITLSLRKIAERTP